MGCQFIHVETYALIGAQNRQGLSRRSLRDIQAELTRQPYASSHVAAPLQPNVLMGSMNDAFIVAEWQARTALDAAGRKYRRTSPALLAGVLSWPVQSIKLNDNSSQFERYLAFRTDTIAWLSRKFGDNLKCCVEHNDEEYPNLHFIVVPALPADRRMSLSTVHPGIKARQDARNAGASRKEIASAYTRAMRNFQDEFWLEVAQFHGLTREGPRRRRLSRREWRLKKAHVKEIAKLHDARRRQEAELIRAGDKRVEAVRIQVVADVKNKLVPRIKAFVEVRDEQAFQILTMKQKLSHAADEIAALKARIADIEPRLEKISP
ncbi:MULTISPECIES: hypothetical protein [Afipia]|uniref:Plasmid recombination enzyme n=2 Tax=Afipia felis TaxID=1035 RepID=A0A380WC87_AFIFE|nr:MULTISPECIES: hypothetical protein [Afipia]EFI51326.1 hypothetical protein AfiDRAFT_2699 [Afipia sp. 1NLS2]EKS29231.1 hypothetical protein HMPREF9697_01759 [Afipia felis ATCC 53690]SUU77938.1 Uncharacterised protein [Afipia felis]SUU86003.1 Uncharacterised protein [Afipia felis]